MAASRQYVTNTFHPLGSTYNDQSFLYTYISKGTNYIFHAERKTVLTRIVFYKATYGLSEILNLG